jgi:hypothetical protein
MFKVLPFVACLCAALIPVSSLAHAHCDIKPWGVLTSSKVLPSLPYTVPADKDAFPIFFQPMLNDPPPPGSSTCTYEISDVTQVSVVFTFSGVLKVNNISFGGFTSGVKIEPVDPIYFVSGVAHTFQLEPHDGNDPAFPGPSTQIMPSNLYEVTLQGFGVLKEFTITSASISLSGHHYYLATTIPEPGSWALAMAGLVVIGGAGRRRRRQAFGCIDGLNPSDQR